MTADQIRAAMGSDFAALADRLRQDFGAKLVWLKTDAFEIGNDPSRGSVPTSGKDDDMERLRYWYGDKQIREDLRESR